MSPKEVEEKMHLDETKCCSRKRKRRRRRTLSNSDDEEEDTSYVPEVERPDTPPMKKRKVRSNTVRNVYSNGFMDHEYHHYDKKKPKMEPDLDPEDLLIPCEQTMIEGDTEIINPNDSDDSGATSPTKVRFNLYFVKKFTSLVYLINSLKPRLHIPGGSKYSSATQHHSPIPITGAATAKAAATSTPEASSKTSGGHQQYDGDKSSPTGEPAQGRSVHRC